MGIGGSAAKPTMTPHRRTRAIRDIDRVTRALGMKSSLGRAWNAPRSLPRWINWANAPAFPSVGFGPRRHPQRGRPHTDGAADPHPGLDGRPRRADSPAQPERVTPLGWGLTMNSQGGAKRS